MRILAQTVKNLPTIQETQVQSQGWEDPLEKGTATHSTILAWRTPWTELQYMGSQRPEQDCTPTKGYYSASKRKEILTQATTQMNLEDVTLNEISQTQKDKY